MKSLLTMAAGAFVLMAAQGSWAQPVVFPEPLSPRIANYQMEVELDPDTRTVTGRETLTWRNTTGRAARDLQFHLYPNAFRNNRSSFMKEAGPGAWKNLAKMDGWGFIEVTRIGLSEGEDLTAEIEFIHPDDNNALDRTVMRVPLSRPVLPGKSISVEIEFATRLPEPPVARSGARRTYFFVSQWFPKIGVLEEGGWNCHQYHAHSEFFADFGVYDVAITVPWDYVVGATGEEWNNEVDEEGDVVHYFHAEDVHDFVWTASPGFVEFTGRSQDVDIRVLMHKEHAGQGERHLEAARLAVQYFQDYYGDYPYPNLTVVDPRKGAGETAGMEYPTLITAGTYRGLPDGIRTVEMVIIHEFGHNFWYHLVATNEFEESWLDEGINTYSEIRIMHDIYGPEKSFADFMGIEFDDMYVRRHSYVDAPDLDPMLRTSWGYYSSSSYRSNSYSKPAMALLTLENLLGKDVVRDILREYLKRYRFKHPHTSDFTAVASEVAGQDLSWFFDQLLFDNAACDYAVGRVSSEKVEPGKGFDYTLSVTGEDAEQAGEKEEEMYETVVKVRRLEGFYLPVETVMTFADGTTVREKWDGKDAWVEYRYVRPVRLVKASVDPERKLLLDIDFTNNDMTLKKAKKAKKPGNYYLELLKYMFNPRL